jgi:cysteine-rich repeat protein
MRHSIVVALIVAISSTAAAQIVPVCGNAIVEIPETCDDGNLVAGDGCSAVCQVENHLPDCTDAFPTASHLWPPNHKFVEVGVGGVVDPDGDPVTITIVTVHQDEPLAGEGDGNTCPDAVGLGSDTTSIRSERGGPGDGRVYHIAFRADDGRGGVCDGEVEVCVPHDQGQGSGCGDQGARVDSTGDDALARCDGDDCEPHECVPEPEVLAPAECEGDVLPGAVERRLDRARLLLERAEDAEGIRVARLHARAARVLHRAAVKATRAAARDVISDACGEAWERRLEGAATCAMCVEDEE